MGNLFLNWPVILVRQSILNRNDIMVNENPDSMPYDEKFSSLFSYIFLCIFYAFPGGEYTDFEHGIYTALLVIYCCLEWGNGKRKHFANILKWSTWWFTNSFLFVVWRISNGVQLSVIDLVTHIIIESMTLCWAFLKF